MATEKHTIAVLGAGNVGGTLGPKWIEAGHQVAFGVSDPNGKHAQALRDKMGDKAVIGTVDTALSNNPEIVVLALPGAAVEPVITQYAKQLDGRIVIDVSNRSMGTGTMNSFDTLHKQVPNALPFRAFNTYGMPNFAQPFSQGTVSLFYCGPDGDARTTVEQLITDVGSEPVYVGGVDQVEVVDGLGRLWFALVMGQKRGMHTALKLLTD